MVFLYLCFAVVWALWVVCWAALWVGVMCSSILAVVCVDWLSCLVFGLRFSRCLRVVFRLRAV